MRLTMPPRKVDKSLILYGNGKLGNLAKEVLDKLNIPVTAIIDRDSTPEFMWNNRMTPIRRNMILPVNRMTSWGEFLVAVCVATEPYKPIDGFLKGKGFTDIVSIYDILLEFPECGITSGWQVGEESDDEPMWTLPWSDTTSVSHYAAYVAWHLNRREIPTITPIDTTNRWNIPELKLTGEEKEFTYHEYPGSTLADIRWRRDTFPIFQVQRHLMNFYYIQLHLEGRELDNIRDNMAYFQTVRPKIAVTVYHTRDGLWKIEKELMDNLRDYLFYFRLHAYQGQGAIMYCVPKEA